MYILRHLMDDYGFGKKMETLTEIQSKTMEILLNPEKHTKLFLSRTGSLDAGAPR